MTLAYTYREQVRVSRQDRSRRAFFWAKVVSFVLMITVAATLRADPELRRVLINAGMDAVSRVMQVSGQQSHIAQHAPAKSSWKPNKTSNPTGAAPLTPDIKVNRYGATKPAQAVTLEQRLNNAPGVIRP
ncbi:hypothetical protein [Sulfitobacter aestuariivivens]|uniref:Uncharacterized protein n=1 Tax=Sulfitobacter aestuariivivens TaxID=2766981 RepID=A0A927D4T1_9RHOB|nr:hypothetical protein [Sulfitobacter aestuariivivens]MBD3664228.1 hypothetical protein [Sulfitobacter aestuariivivens]